MNTCDPRRLISLDGQHALVTGAAGTIGSAVSRLFAAAGASVTLHCHGNIKRAEELAGDLQAAGSAVSILQADLCDEQSVCNLFEQAQNLLGPLDILVNNAGIFTVSLQEELTASQWDEVFSLNARGVFLCCREASSMMKTSGGSIIMISSINAHHPGFGGTAHYDAAKGAVDAYTRSLAAELASHSIRVNAVAPGLVDAPRLREHASDLAESVLQRTPLGRLVTPDDVAGAVLFLASPASACITGTTMIVDGGYLLT